AAVFRQHITLAQKHTLPIVIHGRNGADYPSAYADILEVLKEEGCQRGHAHSFGGTEEEAQAFLAQGFYIGVTGIVTFEKKVEELKRIVINTPLDRILIETDSPYLTPVPFRGKRNEPPYVDYVARKIAELKGVGYDEVVRQTARNAVALYRLRLTI
ncbi:MAG: TatD family hydrolase, partial [Candidatus Komeilibacteria bacterium]|nr:TatD family hydrolase [Candidatus Komeilibacteria bacterium]